MINYLIKANIGFIKCYCKGVSPASKFIEGLNNAVQLKTSR